MSTLLQEEKPIITEGRKLTATQIAIMAIAAGVSVANIYYNQPILQNIAQAFGVPETAVGNIPMLSQIGYGVGLFFLVPLGDKANRKKLVVWMLILLAATLALMTFATSLTLVFIASVLIGILSVSPQIIIPMAAGIDKENKGKTTGTIFSGLLIGILAARVFSGLIAHWLGWRYVYGISFGMVLVIAVLLQTTLPDVRQTFSGNYLRLLQSTLQQVKRFGLLRKSAVLGALVFGTFCSFWTTLTFHLSGAPFFYHSDKIGLFGFVAIAGALLAPIFGKRADGGHARRLQLISTGILIASVIMIQVFPYSLTAFIVAVLLLDVGVQATHIINVARNFTLDETSHSRINTVYMTSYFIGGAIGTFAGVQCWKAGGWNFVTWQMLLWSVVAFLIVLFEKRKSKTNNHE